MKNLINLILLIVVFTTNVFSQSTKILTKRINSSPIKSIEFTNDITIKESLENYPRINLKIESNVPQSTLDALVKSGRYDIETVFDGEKVYIRLPKLAKKVTVDSQEIVEKISCEIYLPNNIKID